jgi:hypothetical protein
MSALAEGRSSCSFTGAIGSATSTPTPCIHGHDVIGTVQWPEDVRHPLLENGDVRRTCKMGRSRAQSEMKSFHSGLEF